MREKEILQRIINSSKLLQIDKTQWLSIGILSIILSITFIILNEIFVWVNVEFGELVPTGLGAIGTLLLAWVTVQTIRQNEELVKHQEARLRPILRNFGDIEGGVSNKIRTSKNRIIIGFENIGEGKAIDINLKPRLYVYDDDTGERIILSKYINQNKVALPEIEPRLNTIYREADYRDIELHAGGVLDSGDRDKFTRRVDFHNAERDRKDKTYPYVPNIIVFDWLLVLLKTRTNIEKMAMDYELEYRDILGNKYTRNINGEVFELEETEDFEEATGGPLYLPHN